MQDLTAAKMRELLADAIHDNNTFYFGCWLTQHAHALIAMKEREEKYPDDFWQEVRDWTDLFKKVSEENELLKEQAARVPVLEREVERLKAQNQRLQTQIPPGPPNPPKANFREWA